MKTLLSLTLRAARGSSISGLLLFLAVSWLSICPRVWAVEGSPDAAATWLAAGQALAADAPGAADAPHGPAKGAATAKAHPKPPPLPLHTIEGLGGTLTVPSAYLCNCGVPGTKCSLPSVSFTYLYFSGGKSLQAAAVTQTFFRRLAVSYAVNRLDLGSFPHAMAKATGGAVHTRQDLYMHNFNLRAMLIEENSFGQSWMPAITAGVHFKYNTGIESLRKEITKKVGVDLLRGIGYQRNYGMDYTLTASKTVVIGRPFIFSATLRNSSGSNIGLTGFADHCQFSVECHAICLVTDWLCLAYEFRQKSNPYDRIPGLMGKESNWHAILVGIILSDRLTLAGGWARMGELANADADGVWGIQIKYEF